MRQVLLGLSALLVTIQMTLASSAIADFGRPHPVSPPGLSTEVLAQATTARGRTTYLYVVPNGFGLRVRRADGTLGHPVVVYQPSTALFSSHQAIAVGPRGDGIVAWTEEGETVVHGQLFARRFTRHGRLGPVVRISPRTPEDESVLEVGAAVENGGRAVITWNLQAGAGYRPWLRTLSPRSTRTRALQIGSGGNVGAVLPLATPDGRALVVWNNNRVLARTVGRAGRVGPLHRVQRPRHTDQLAVEDLAMDGRGVALVCGTYLTPVRIDPTGQPHAHYRAWTLRVSSHARRVGRLRTVSPRHMAVDDFYGVKVGVGARGHGVVTWNTEAVFAREIRPDGSVGPLTRVGHGHRGDVALSSHGDGVVTSSWFRGDYGEDRRVRVTRVRHGHVRGSEFVAHGRLQSFYWQPSVIRRGRVTVSFGLDDRLVAVSGR